MREMWLGILLLMIVGCARTEYSQVLHEPAKVLETRYIPSKTTTTISIYIDGDGDSVPVVDTDTTPEQHMTVFKCQHGKFAVDDAMIWKKLQDGDDVDVSYKEIYDVWYKNGKETERKVVKFDFIDAVRVSGSGER